MTVAKPTLTAYSPGDSAGFTITNGLWNTEVLQQGAWTQLMLGAATAFPASPNTADTCFRSDLGAWFRYDGTAWQQMGLATFTTAARPAAPPTAYRYFDTTANAVYRWTGSAYVTDPLAVPADIATATAGVVPLTVENTNVTPTADLQDWKANGALVAMLGPTGDLGLLGATAFPSSPVTNQTCYRRDLGAWFRYNGTAWRQMGDAYFTTAARPAAPPTDYRYRDLTDRFTYRWTGSAYQKTQTTIKQLDYVAATDLLNGAAVVGTPTNVCADQTFTVSDAGSQLDVFVVIAGVHTPGASPSAVVFTVYVDSTTSYVFSQSYGNSSSNQSFTGAAICIGSLTAGSHTVRVRYQASAATTLTLTPAANATYYAFRLQVLERLP